MNSLYLYEDITDETALRVREAVNNDEIDTIWLNSTGGDVTSALAIYDALIGKQVTVIGTGQVSSAAILILLAGEHRYATTHCRFLIHAIQSETGGEVAELIALQGIVNDILENRTNMSRVEVESFFANESSYTGVDDALDLGMIDAIWPNVIPPATAAAATLSTFGAN